MKSAQQTKCFGIAICCDVNLSIFRGQEIARTKLQNSGKSDIPVAIILSLTNYFTYGLSSVLLEILVQSLAFQVQLFLHQISIFPDEPLKIDSNPRR